MLYNKQVNVSVITVYYLNIILHKITKIIGYSTLMNLIKLQLI